MSFDAIYLQYYKKSFLFAKSYVHDRSAAEDIATDALITLWEKMKTETVIYPPVFLLTVLKNKSLDYLKHEAIRQETFKYINKLQERELDIRISTLQACEPEEILSSELNHIIQEVLNDLPQQTTEIFRLSRFDNKTNKEIAEKVGISTKGVEYHITKALKVFKLRLKDYLPLLFFT